MSSDKFEIQGKDFLSKIDNAYNKIFKNNNDVVEIVTDGEKNIAQNKIRDCIDKIINAAGK
jgi:thymidylate kinase